MQAVAKILRERANEHLSSFCEQFEQRSNFASRFKSNGTIQKTPKWYVDSGYLYVNYEFVYNLHIMLPYVSVCTRM